MTSVIKAVAQSPNKLLRIQATMPLLSTGAGRASMGLKICAIIGLNVYRFDQRSLMAERVLYQFIKSEVANEVVK